MPGKTSAKAQLRREIRRTLKRLATQKIAADSQILRKKLQFPDRSKIALFAGTATEPNLLDLISDNPRVDWFLPKMIGPGEMDFIRIADIGSLQKGPFGILEPMDGRKAKTLDCIVCPGLAFTKSGKRLGQGGGFYDRALPRFAEARVIGVAFTCQILDDLPAEEHDLEMDLVLTPDSAAPNEIQEY